MDFIKVKLDQSVTGLHGRMQQLMDEMLNLNRPLLSEPGRGWTPEADLFETEGEVFLIANLAGVPKEAIEVSIHENHLRIGGERPKMILSGTRTQYHHLEMGHGDFERVFRIPTAVDQDNIEATYVDGLLTVRMRKKTKKPRKVRVKVRN